MKNRLKKAIFFANLLDSKFKIFGIKFGIDPIIGLIPGGGDLISLALSLYIVWIGIEMELPKNKIVLMIRNILLDFGIGLIPILGDVADFAFKSNLMNLEVLKQHAEKDIIEGEIVE